MHVEIVDVEGTLLREIADTRLKRNDVALTYAIALRQTMAPDSREAVDWWKVNHAIMDRWSLAGLKYVKERAWAIYEGRT